MLRNVEKIECLFCAYYTTIIEWLVNQILSLGHNQLV